MKLPNGERAIVPIEKLRNYYLHPTHRVGSHKAHVFESVPGLTAAHAEELQQRLFAKGQQAIWSAGDIADWVFMAPAEKVSADILIDLYPILNQVRTAYGLDKREVTYTFFHAYAEGCAFRL